MTSRKTIRQLLKENPHITLTSSDASTLQGSDLEALFHAYWQQAGGPELIKEYHFHPKHDWRFDFFHLPSMTAIEIDGIGGKHSRHTSIKGYADDALKCNIAQIQGYRVLHLSTGFTYNDVCMYAAFLNMEPAAQRDAAYEYSKH